MLFKRKRRRIVIFLLVLIVLVSLLTIYTGLQSLNERKLNRLHLEQDESLRRRKSKSGINVIVGHYIGAGTMFGNNSNGNNSFQLSGIVLFMPTALCRYQ